MLFDIFCFSIEEKAKKNIEIQKRKRSKRKIHKTGFPCRSTNNSLCARALSLSLYGSLFILCYLPISLRVNNCRAARVVLPTSMSRRLSKANSITTYDTATLWRALEASSVNQQNRSSQKESARRWQRAANRLLRQNTITTIPSNTNEHSPLTYSASTGSCSTGGGGGGSALINSVLKHFF